MAHLGLYRGALLSLTGIGLLAGGMFLAGPTAAENPENGPIRSFSRVAQFYVSGGVAEIVAATPDGKTLVYTDADAQELGFVDITNVSAPVEIGTVAVDGEPTSVAVTPDGKWVLGTVRKTGDDKLYVIKLPARSVERIIPLDGQPDSIDVSPDGAFAAIAIENERAGDGPMPEGAAGFLTVVKLTGAPATWTTSNVALTGLADADRFPTDPEPEFVKINAANKAAVTLQENNHIVIVDLATETVVTHFSAGRTTHGADTKRNNDISLTDTITNARREPDAITWTPGGNLVTANEGDYNIGLTSGQFIGGRDFTVYSATGTVLFEPGASAELEAVKHGHYPDSRSNSKGAEFEGVTVGVYKNRTFLFVGSERGNFVLVYDLAQETNPKLVQLLPTGVSPEGLLALPQRNLFVTSNEVDGSLSIFQGNPGLPSDYPDVVSEGVAWSGLSGAVAVAGNVIAAVPDNVFSPSRIFTLQKASDVMRVTSALTMTKAGSPVTYDLEGIELRGDGGYWMAVEGAGNAPTATSSNRILSVDPDGSVVAEIELPAAVKANQRSNGFEGLAANADASQVYVAFQREWADDAAGFVKIGRYTPATGEWAFFHYPIDAAPAGAWVGLSEITRIDDTTFAIVERDNQAGAAAAVKRIYEVSVAGLTPQAAQPYPVLTKTLVHDILAVEGYRVAKWEAAALLPNGKYLVANDNDGAGETRVVEFRYP